MSGDPARGHLPAGSPPRLAGLPIPEDREQPRFDLRTDVGRRQAAGELDRLPHLPDVLVAAGASRDVMLEAVPLLLCEGVLEVVRHQLDELLAAELFDACAHSGSMR